MKPGQQRLPESGELFCGRCRTEASRDRLAGLTFCSHCGAGINDRELLRRCPQCAFSLVKDSRSERWSCENCGYRVPIINEYPPETPPRRPVYWRWFWSFFLGMPLLATGGVVNRMLLPNVLPAEWMQWLSLVPEVVWLLAPVVVGALGSGWCLARIYDAGARSWLFAARVLLFGLGVVFFYVGVLAIGCAAVFGF